MSFTKGHGVDAERSPHHKQVVDRQSHPTNISTIIMIQMKLMYQIKTAMSACIPQKLPANCSSVRQLQQHQKKTAAAGIARFTEALQMLLLEKTLPNDINRKTEIIMHISVRLSLLIAMN